MIKFNTFDFNFIYSLMDNIASIDITNIIVFTTILVSITSIIMLSSGSGKKIVDGLIKGLQAGAAGSVIATAVNTGFGTKLIKDKDNNGNSSGSDKTTDSNSTESSNNTSSKGSK